MLSTYSSNAELNQLSKECHMFYHGGLRQLIQVKVGKLSTCVDCPERSSMFQVGDHNGTYSTFWGHATFVDGECKQNRLPSCTECRKQNLTKALPGGETSINVETPRSNDKCSSWNVLSDSFYFPLPKLYPTTCDNRPTAPKPPAGREIFGNKRPSSFLCNDVNAIQEQQLKTIPLSPTWLKGALRFAHHNMKTQPPHALSVKKKYWTKGMLTSYLRSCGVNSQLILAVYTSAKEGEDDPPFPSSWKSNNALSICHYAPPMHMLFLGHIKSDYDMTSKFLSNMTFWLRTFGRQANLYLQSIQKLRVWRYFAAQPLSTSSWGTGVWVSENYLFWARCIKFFATLPGLHNSRLIACHASDFGVNLLMYVRFVSATHYCISRIMSSQRFVPQLQTSMNLYMDTMVEFDRWLLNLKDNEDLDNDDCEDTPSTTVTIDTPHGANSHLSTSKGSRMKKANFVKSNSLGLMSVSKFHSHTGPAEINWDGGRSGS